MPKVNEDKSYRGYRLQVSRYRAGWKVFIYAPGAVLAENDIPHTDDPDGQGAVLREAMAFVDRKLNGSN